MEDGGDTLVSSNTYEGYPSTTFLDEVVARLQNVLEEQWSKQLQVVNANIIGRLESMFQELLSKQDVALGRLVDVVQGQGDAETSRSQELCRSISLPDVLNNSNAESQEDIYRKLLQHAHCSSRWATATPLRRLHTDQLLRKTVKLPSERTMFSCSGALILRPGSSLDEAKSAIENARLQESKKKTRKTRRIGHRTRRTDWR